jgi:hypothetical protein
MPSRSRGQANESHLPGRQFRRLVVAARRRGSPQRWPPKKPPRAKSSPIPAPPRQDSLDHFHRLTLSDWQVLAGHLYRHIRRRDQPLADSVWHVVWQVDQGLRQSLSSEVLPTPRHGLGASAVRRAYDALMHDIRGKPRKRSTGRRLGARKKTLRDSEDIDIVVAIMDRLHSIFELVDAPPWPWRFKQAPWPQLIHAVRHYSPKVAAVEILAWALGKKPSYIKRLIERPRRPLGL